MSAITEKAGGRVARKKAEARARIVRSAERLFRKHGVEGVTIQDITAAADVGHGTFYLHFKSKQEVLVPIMVAEAASLDARVQGFLGDDADPATVLATSSRYIGRAVVGDPLWRWFLQNTGLPGESLRAAFGEFTNRDFQRGVESGRFTGADVRTAVTFAFGGFVSVLMAAIERGDATDMIDLAAGSMLAVLGVPAADAADIIRHPLPDEA